MGKDGILGAGRGRGHLGSQEPVNVSDCNKDDGSTVW